MLDEIAIQQTINTYSNGVGRSDWDRVVSTFMPDGIWETAGLGKHQGHGAIQQVMAGFMAQMAYFVQINSPAIITVEGDTATASSVIRECGKFADRDEALEALGFYDDELVRTPQGWKFALRTFKAAGMHRFPLLPGAPLG